MKRRIFRKALAQDCRVGSIIDRKLYERQFRRRYGQQGTVTTTVGMPWYIHIHTYIYIYLYKRGSPFPVPDNCAPHLCKPVNHPVASPCIHRRRCRSKSPLLSITLRPSIHHYPTTPALSLSRSITSTPRYHLPPVDRNAPGGEK